MKKRYQPVNTQMRPKKKKPARPAQPPQQMARERVAELPAHCRMLTYVAYVLADVIDTMLLEAVGMLERQGADAPPLRHLQLPLAGRILRAAHAA